MSEFDGIIGHLENIDWPWAAAGGVVKTMSDVEAMAQTAVGWVEDGSQTLAGRLGNATDPEHPELGEQFDVYHHNPVTGESGNSIGMKGKPADEWLAEIPEKVLICAKHGKKFVQNVAPVSDNPEAESRELVARAYEARADAVLLNAGCPNVVTEDGGRHELLSRNPLALAKVLFGLQDITRKYKPIFLRISPQLSHAAMRDIIWSVRYSGVVSAVFTPNTWPDFMPTDQKGQPVPLGYMKGTGGLSGPAVAGRAAEQTVWAVDHLTGSKVDVVSSAGIMTGQELSRRRKLGAVAGAGTTFYYESADWRWDTRRLLESFVSIAQ